jgi:hypothetical protein
MIGERATLAVNVSKLQPAKYKGNGAAPVLPHK